jgi:hypothetical protein
MGVLDRIRSADLDPLVESERLDLIYATCQLPDDNQQAAWQAAQIESVYSALLRRGELDRRTIETYFSPAKVGGQGFFTEFDRWWHSEGRSQCASLVGVEKTSIGLTVPEGAIDGLSEFRDLPEVRVQNYCDEHHGPHSAESETLLDLWLMVRADSPISTGRLQGSYRTPSLEQWGDRLVDLPYIRREIEHPPDPTDLVLGEDIHTLQDLLDARSEVDAEPTEVWHFDEDVGGEADA